MTLATIAGCWTLYFLAEVHTESHTCAKSTSASRMLDVPRFENAGGDRVSLDRFEVVCDIFSSLSFYFRVSQVVFRPRISCLSQLTFFVSSLDVMENAVREYLRR